MKQSYGPEPSNPFKGADALFWFVAIVAAFFLFLRSCGV